ncbi:MAG: hypothetical protein K8T10_03495 [Candidatus Eremiobacteraeota bacterium]|nr:hypothetical protein [Candidatus Eremiobacteraeota bacterium]
MRNISNLMISTPRGNGLRNNVNRTTLEDLIKDSEVEVVGGDTAEASKLIGFFDKCGPQKNNLVASHLHG